MGIKVAYNEKAARSEFLLAYGRGVVSRKYYDGLTIIVEFPAKNLATE